MIPLFGKFERHGMMDENAGTVSAVRVVATEFLAESACNSTCRLYWLLVDGGASPSWGHRSSHGQRDVPMAAKTSFHDMDDLEMRLYGSHRGLRRSLQLDEETKAIKTPSFRIINWESWLILKHG